MWGHIGFIRRLSVVDENIELETGRKYIISNGKKYYVHGMPEMIEDKYRGTIGRDGVMYTGD